MPTPIFRLVAEGPTDHAVIIRLLAGLLNDSSVDVALLQPDPSLDRNTPDGSGGWAQVLRYIAAPHFEKAFQFADFVIVHIDTDVSQEYGVSGYDDGITIQPVEMVARVIGNLRERIAPDVWERIGHQVIFAIPVDSIECWLLVAHAEQGKENKSLNCLPLLNNALRRKNLSPIGEPKSVSTYERLAKPFHKQRDLSNYRKLNDSLAIFLDSVEQAISRQTTGQTPEDTTPTAP